MTGDVSVFNGLECIKPRLVFCARVAERAGVSVSSLYQYFPNKAAILLRLQSNEWRETSSLLSDILSDRSRLPSERLRSLVHAFLLSECEEAAVRGALNDAAPLYHGAPEAREVRDADEPLIAEFMVELIPDALPATRDLAGELVMTTMSTVGKDFSGNARTKEEIEVYTDAMAAMLSAYIRELK